MTPLDARRLAEVLCTVTTEASLLVMREAGSAEDRNRAAVRRLRAAAFMLGPMQAFVLSLGDFLARLDELRVALAERERVQVRVAAERLLATLPIVPIG